MGLKRGGAEEPAGTPPGTEHEAVASALLGKRWETWSGKTRTRKDLGKHKDTEQRHAYPDSSFCHWLIFIKFSKLEGDTGRGGERRRTEGKECIFPGKNKVCTQASENTGYFTAQDISKVLAFCHTTNQCFASLKLPEECSSISQHVNCHIMQPVASAQERGVAVTRLKWWFNQETLRNLPSDNFLF